MEQGVPVNYFAVEPRKDCPHIETDVSFLEWSQVPVDVVKQECQMCHDKEENWRCLKCQGVFCSRYVNGHMNKHYDETNHKIAISFSDLSTWCYACDDYITSPELRQIETSFAEIKFPENAVVIIGGGRGGGDSSSTFTNTPTSIIINRGNGNASNVQSDASNSNNVGDSSKATSESNGKKSE
ncbi:3731_t:CDS:2 [Ambispora leptoticha]|uniref:3731_t:CDS:1 n=1 Tax=Ambispora leptoticha TaxID=144679 RepID=A0A9N9CAS8_9GLOM|nr:3731_t:CDS:2 [Ambispora leptoticha]